MKKAAKSNSQPVVTSLKCDDVAGSRKVRTTNGEIGSEIRDNKKCFEASLYFYGRKYQRSTSHTSFKGHYCHPLPKGNN